MIRSIITSSIQLINFAEGYRRATSSNHLINQHTAHNTKAPTTTPSTAATPPVCLGAAAPAEPLVLTPAAPLADPVAGAAAALPDPEAAAEVLMVIGFTAIDELAEYVSKAIVCPSATIPLEAWLTYSPAMKAAGPPRDRGLPSTASAPEREVTV